ncbi:MAG: DoxX family protein [Patescibacteria group bacterium]
MNEILFLVSRILVGGYFLMNGINHFRYTAMMVPYTQSKGVPMPKLAVLGTGVLMLVGGLGILLGVWVSYAVLALIAFLVPVTFIMHNFWTIEDPNQRLMDMIHFMKNIALVGAVLAYLAVPMPWAWSVLL